MGRGAVHGAGGGAECHAASSSKPAGVALLLLQQQQQLEREELGAVCGALLRWQRRSWREAAWRVLRSWRPRQCDSADGACTSRDSGPGAQHQPIAKEKQHKKGAQQCRGLGTATACAGRSAGQQPRSGRAEGAPSRCVQGRLAMLPFSVC